MRPRTIFAARAHRRARTSVRSRAGRTGNADDAPDAWAEQVQARRLFDELRRRPDADESAGALAGVVERDRGSVAACRSRRVRVSAADRALEGFWRRDEQPRMEL